MMLSYFENMAAGIERTQIVVDPGIGFGKTVEHNLLLMRQLAKFRELGAPVLVGPPSDMPWPQPVGAARPGLSAYQWAVGDPRVTNNHRVT